METGTKPQSGRATDRVLEALSTLSNLLDRTINEVKALDTDFQDRLRQSVHETEASLQSKAAEHLEFALNETRTKLEEQFSKRFAELSSQSEEERDKLKAEFAKMAGIAAQGEEERNRLKAEFAKMNGIAAQGEEERNRLKAEVAKMTETTSKWEAERARLNGELQHLAKVQAATQAEAEKALMALKGATAASKSAKSALNTQALNTEIDRVQAIIKTISDLIEDPAIELATLIRKNVERAELEAYLKGIRYALNGAESK